MSLRKSTSTKNQQIIVDKLVILSKKINSGNGYHSIFCARI